MKKAIVLMMVLALFLSVGLLWAGGGKEQAPEAEEQREETASTEEAEDSKYGGTLRKAYFAPASLDPAFTTSITDEEICRFWGDFLVYVDEELRPDKSRSLAKDWKVSDDGLTYTFMLREGITYHNGADFTSEDVKFTFDRLRDPEVGAATVAIYASIESIETPDDYTVVFNLTQPNPDLVTLLGDYHAIVLDSDTTDFNSQNGTGAFIVTDYLPEDRMTFKRNPDYWRTDDEGNQLPYVDGIDYIFLSEPSAQVEALRGGQVDFLLYLPSEYVQTVENDPNLVVYQKPSNTHYVIHMRSDREPFSNVKVRQAFKAAVDRDEILQGSFEGLGVEGLDTFIGPAYADFYLDVPPLKRDPEKAKQLLADAGYEDGLTITLTTQQASPVPAIATILKEQLADAGITVDIQLVPSDVYYGADSLWLKADFSITDWGARPTPQPYLDLAYTCGAKWNESHFCDPEVDRLSEQAAKELDREKRAEIYKDIQRIFIDRGPVIIPFFANSLWGATKDLKGVVPSGYLGTSVDLAQVYFDR
jgi:peptide/nickel transport system substrate-binding protein